MIAKENYTRMTLLAKGDCLRNKIPFILCIIGGALMLYAGVVGSVGIWEQLGNYVVDNFAPEASPIVFGILVILGNIASLGGIAVFVGGYFLTTDRVGIGKFIIGIAAGLGIFGFIMLIINMYLAMGVAAFAELLNILATTASILGPVLTIVARMMAKKPE
ncbi:hypothetical protein EU527_09225 [Candidatus Thorarchaeota archaeon]|nr:MAG: hypothetical protein EU527_09225 [Candidatus Thorarchaeota archaeon]